MRLIGLGGILCALLLLQPTQARADLDSDTGIGNSEGDLSVSYSDYDPGHQQAGDNPSSARRHTGPSDFDLFVSNCRQGDEKAANKPICLDSDVRGQLFTNRPGGLPGIQVPAVARSAVAKLTLPGSVPKVGPPPSINEWKMAAVGYPLWLWTNDATRLSTRVESQGITITITAKRTSTTFAMGDGGSLTCESMTPWSRAVTPGLHSPDCGYTYVKASLPRGNYTITATTTWSVHWTAEGYSGDIPVTISGTSELPVGELQSLVTKRR